MLAMIGVLTALGATPRSAGILYELWHCEAATAMAQVKARGLSQLTTETVIRSNGNISLDDVYPASHGPFASADIYNAEPAELGFYCLCSKRVASDTLPDCPGAAAVARRHAELLTSAGFDYVALDITNWPQVNAATDVAVLRPLEVLFDNWLHLRARGLRTPAIAPWCLSPVAAYADGHQTTWQWLLDHVYNNATRAPLVWSGHTGKLSFFLPATSAYNGTVDAMIRHNGGRQNIDTIKMWALNVGKGASTWGFFAPCTTSDGAFTTSMVGTGEPCNQFPALNATDGSVEEVSASGGYMLSQCSLPFASPGHMRGLTLQRLFAQVVPTARTPPIRLLCCGDAGGRWRVHPYHTLVRRTDSRAPVRPCDRPQVLQVGAPHLFVSSFNEHIGGRQAPAYKSEIAFNMGLPTDSQRTSVWVDTYAVEFSRDLEPTVEGGTRIWEVASSCVQLYKAGLTCGDGTAARSSACCSTNDKAIFANAWSLANDGARDALVTNALAERDALVSGGSWREVCNPIGGPSVFCVDGSMEGGRDGPFMLYRISTANMDLLPGARLMPLYRCLTNTTKHLLSVKEDCESLGRPEFIVGYVSSMRGWETLRALRRCGDPRVPNANFSHALDLECHEGGGALLGYVR